MGTYDGRNSWQHRLRRRLRGPLRWWIILITGVGLMVGAAAAYAAITLTGRGTVTAPAARTEQLQVSAERLSRPLLPGASANLVFTVRNPNGFPVDVDRVALASTPRAVSPAGCAAQLTGPLLAKGGYPLPAAERITVAAGASRSVTVRDAVRLASSARTGCGFTVDITVQATQGAPVVTPTVAPPGGPIRQPPTSAPTSPVATSATPTRSTPVVTATPPQPPPGGGAEQ